MTNFTQVTALLNMFWRKRSTLDVFRVNSENILRNCFRKSHPNFSYTKKFHSLSAISLI